MKLVVLTSSEKEYEKFRKRHPFLEGRVVPVNMGKSLLAAVSTIIESESEPVLLMQEDVFFRPDFLSRTQELCDKLNAMGLWGCVSESGTCPIELGFTSSKNLKFSFGPDGGPNYKDGLYPAQCLTGKVLLLNTVLLKERKIKLPETENPLFLEIALGAESLCQELPLFISSSLLVTYEKPMKKLLKGVKRDGEEYFSTVLADNILETPYGSIQMKNAKGVLHLRGTALSNSLKITEPKTVTIAVRTQFNRPALLKRCLATIREFQREAKDTDFQLKVVTDCRKEIPLEEYSLQKDEVFACECKNTDTRFELIEAAVKNTSTDYIWFIDDDDWILSQNAALLSKTIASMPQGMTFYLGAEHYWEPDTPTLEDDCFSKAEPAHYLDPAIFPYAFSGINPVPFSAVIFPVKSFQKILENLEYSKEISYFEDYLVIAKNMLQENFAPAVLPELFSGISIRSNENTVFESDRTNWNQSLSVVLYNILNSPNAVAFSLPVNRRVKHLASEYSKPPYGFDTALLVFANKALPWLGKKAVARIPQCKRNYGVNECFRDQWNIIKRNKNNQ